MNQVNLSNNHKPDWALFLPAVSSFYIAGLGKQRKGEEYFEQSRIPAAFNGDVEKLNFLNSKEGLYTYKWGLYSAGHANLDTTKDDPCESIIREREEGTFMLGDSGGFQILKGQWPADWKDPNCPKAMEKRKAVLKWMDTYMDYGMCLDVPSQSFLNKKAIPLHGIHNIEEAITATHINNEYFIQNRNGKCKFLNVLQGTNHAESDAWYQEMKKYCDPNIYPDNHFNGWAFGGQNKIDVHLMLRRFVDIIHDGLLQEGKHDLVHCLGVSILEYAILFSDVQRAIRKYHNPKLQITFDCASPFFSAAKGLAYFNNSFEHGKKWAYAMDKTAESKDYANDNRKFGTAILQDKIHKSWTDSPVTDLMVMKDLCYRGHGFIGQHGKETKTSWDTLSYTLIQSHNVYQHITAVQEANVKYEQGIMPKMVVHKDFGIKFQDIIDEVFSKKTRAESHAVIDYYNSFWKQMSSGSQGFSGKKTVNARTGFNLHFEEDDSDDAMEELMEDIKPVKVKYSPDEAINALFTFN
jgi:hypothetical protein